MAATLDASAIGVSQTTAAITVSLPAGTPSGVVCNLHMVDTGAVTVASVTAGTKSCSFLASRVTAGGFWKVFSYQTTATPDSGTQIITFNLSAAPSHGAFASAISVAGGDTATPVYNVTTAAFASNTSPSLAATCLPTEGAFSACMSNSLTATTPNGAQVEVGTTNVAGTWPGYLSHLFGTASPVMGWTIGPSIDTAMIVGSFKEAAAGGGSPKGSNYYRQVAGMIA